MLGLLAAHYRAPAALPESAFVEARNVLDRLYRAVGDASSDADAFDSSFVAALCDDLNTPAAMARLHELAGAANKGDGDAATALKTNAGLLGLLGQTGDDWARAQIIGWMTPLLTPGLPPATRPALIAILPLPMPSVMNWRQMEFSSRMGPMGRFGGAPSQTASILLTSPFSGRFDGPFGRA